MPTREDRPRNAVTDVAGLQVGHWTDSIGVTGCTVVLCESAMVGGVSVRGGAAQTRETDALGPLASAERVHAVVLAGGAAYGLAAADGVLRYLEDHMIGFRAGRSIVPVVASAVIFDLEVGNRKSRPDASAGYKACEAAASDPPQEGRVGAGTGATVGKLYGRDRAQAGGLGTTSLRAGGCTVGALFVVNCIGEVVDEAGGVIAGARGVPSIERALLRGRRPSLRRPTREGTTVGVVATDATLTKAEANVLAAIAHDGLARAIRPVHTRYDGDTIFVVSTGRVKSADFEIISAAAVTATARAVRRAATVA